MKRLEDVADKIGYLAMGLVFGIGIVAVGVIALLFITGFNYGSTSSLHDISGSKKCQHYDPCVKNQETDGECNEPPVSRHEGYNCSSWACLAENVTDATCQYDAILGTKQCIGECAGTCVTSADCPVVNFTADAGTPTTTCQSNMCVYTVDTANVYINFTANCDSSNSLFMTTCGNYLDYTASNAYVDARCMRTLPVCNNTFGDAGATHLSTCIYYFSCASLTE